MRLIGYRSRAATDGARHGAIVAVVLALTLPVRADEPAALHRVVIAQFAYAPEHLEVRQGDSVEFVNRDLVPHTATAQSGDWDTGGLEYAAGIRVPFSQPGIFDYVCAYHPSMRGRVVVTPAEDQRPLAR